MLKPYWKGEEINGMPQVTFLAAVGREFNKVIIGDSL